MPGIPGMCPDWRSPGSKARRDPERPGETRRDPESARRDPEKRPERRPDNAPAHARIIRFLTPGFRFFLGYPKYSDAFFVDI